MKFNLYATLCIIVLVPIDGAALENPLTHDERECTNYAIASCNLSLNSNAIDQCLASKFTTCMEIKKNDYTMRSETECQSQDQTVDVCYFDEGNDEVCVQVIYEGLQC